MVCHREICRTRISPPAISALFSRQHAAPLARAGASVRLLGPGRLQAVRALPRRLLALRQAALQARDLQGGLPGAPAKPCPPPHAPKAQPASALAQVWTYAYLCLLPALSALAEFVGYRWVVLLGVLGRLATLALLLAPPTNGSLPLMKLQEVFIAAGFAAHPALMAIAYRTLPAEAYSRAAGFTACAGVVAQARAPPALPTHRRPRPPHPCPVSTARRARGTGQLIALGPAAAPAPRPHAVLPHAPLRHLCRRDRGRVRPLARTALAPAAPGGARRARLGRLQPRQPPQRGGAGLALGAVLS